MNEQINVIISKRKISEEQRCVYEYENLNICAATLLLLCQQNVGAIPSKKHFEYPGA
jgi:hypothetical protein